ncbi:hypothetical protein KUBF_48110 [Bacteroides finegoldii]|nr:hypothetical protein KUBF_48110 [Bacteroides finegoldii]
MRNRVNLPDKTTTDAPDKESFMKLLRKERCVELAGEGFRYWDLRRWKLAENIINGQNAHGIKITKNDDSTFSYEKVECDGGTPRIFSKNIIISHYLHQKRQIISYVRIIPTGN